MNETFRTMKALLLIKLENFPHACTVLQCHSLKSVLFHFSATRKYKKMSQKFAFKVLSARSQSLSNRWAIVKWKVKLALYEIYNKQIKKKKPFYVDSLKRQSFEILRIREKPPLKRWITCILVLVYVVVLAAQLSDIVSLYKLQKKKNKKHQGWR